MLRPACRVDYIVSVGISKTCPKARSVCLSRRAPALPVLLSAGTLPSPVSRYVRPFPLLPSGPAGAPDNGSPCSRTFSGIPAFLEMMAGPER
ncbi:hypothetical protein SKAU_G00303150 [Synaphobranchus kaupii]|uniref:Uncharacterized protein n=1 Tax=Synaphobranchus kaupii TaxID=118154 RepID=A0A9Q1IMI0_SYNKA|nr:hypothetical protein SKAU_G00303150 [Synaphobranchus kaupii]